VHLGTLVLLNAHCGSRSLSCVAIPGLSRVITLISMIAAILISKIGFFLYKPLFFTAFYDYLRLKHVFACKINAFIPFLPSNWPSGKIIL
jgi:hypothetical protein